MHYPAHGTLPPLVCGKLNGHLTLKVDEVVWCRQLQISPCEVIVEMHWWGDKEVTVFRPIDVSKHVCASRKDVSITYDIRTSLSLLQSYLKNCDKLKFNVLTSTTREFIGISTLPDLGAVAKENFHQSYYPILNKTGNRIGDLHVSFILTMKQRSKTSSDRGGGDFEIHCHSDQFRNEDCKSKPSKKTRSCRHKQCQNSAVRQSERVIGLSLQKQDVNDNLQTESTPSVTSVFSRALDEGQKLSNAMVMSVLEDCVVSELEEDVVSSGSKEPRSNAVKIFNELLRPSTGKSIKKVEQVVDFLRGKEMSSAEQTSALAALRTLSPTDSMLGLADQQLQERQSTNVLPAEHHDQEDQLRSERCQKTELKTSDDTSKLPEREHLLQMSTVSSDTGKCSSATDKTSLNGLESVSCFRLTIDKLVLTAEGLKKVKFSAVNRKGLELGVTPNASYFVEYQIASGKESQDAWAFKPTRFVSRRHSGNIIYFGHTSVHTFPPAVLARSQLSHLIGQCNIRVLWRHLHQRTPSLLGTPAPPDNEPPLPGSCHSFTLPLLSKLGTLVGHLNVKLEFGQESQFKAQPTRNSSSASGLGSLDRRLNGKVTHTGDENGGVWSTAGSRGASISGAVPPNTIRSIRKITAQSLSNNATQTMVSAQHPYFLEAGLNLMLPVSDRCDYGDSRMSTLHERNDHDTERNDFEMVSNNQSNKEPSKNCQVMFEFYDDGHLNRIKGNSYASSYKSQRRDLLEPIDRCIGLDKIHEFVIGVDAVKRFPLFSGGQSYMDCYVDYRFPEHDASGSVVLGARSSSTEVTICTSETKFSSTKTHRLKCPCPLYLPLPGITFTVWCRYFSPTPRDHAVAMALIPMAKLSAMQLHFDAQLTKKPVVEVLNLPLLLVPSSVTTPFQNHTTFGSIQIRLVYKNYSAPQTEAEITREVPHINSVSENNVIEKDIDLAKYLNEYQDVPDKGPSSEMDNRTTSNVYNSHASSVRLEEKNYGANSDYHYGNRNLAGGPNLNSLPVYTMNSNMEEAGNFIKLGNKTSLDPNARHKIEGELISDCNNESSLSEIVTIREPENRAGLYYCTNSTKRLEAMQDKTDNEAIEFGATVFRERYFHDKELQDNPVYESEQFGLRYLHDGLPDRRTNLDLEPIRENELYNMISNSSLSVMHGVNKVIESEVGITSHYSKPLCTTNEPFMDVGRRIIRSKNHSGSTSGSASSCSDHVSETHKTSISSKSEVLSPRKKIVGLGKHVRHVGDEVVESLNRVRQDSENKTKVNVETSFLSRPQNDNSSKGLLHSGLNSHITNKHWPVVDELNRDVNLSLSSGTSKLLYYIPAVSLNQNDAGCNKSDSTSSTQSCRKVAKLNDKERERENANVSSLNTKISSQGMKENTANFQQEFHNSTGNLMMRTEQNRLVQTLNTECIINEKLKSKNDKESILDNCDQIGNISPCATQCSKTVGGLIGNETLMGICEDTCYNVNSGTEDNVFKVRVELERALHLGEVRKLDRSGRWSTISPSTYITFQKHGTGCDNELNSGIVVTQVVENDCNPIWNCSWDLQLPVEYLLQVDKRLVLRLWQSCRGRVDLVRDSVVGFAAIDLTVLAAGLPQLDGWFNIVDFVATCKGQIKVTVTPLEDLAGLLNDLNQFGTCKNSSPIQSVEPSVRINSLPHGDHADLYETGSMKQKTMQQALAQPSKPNTDHLNSHRCSDYEDVSTSFLVHSLKEKMEELDVITAGLKEKLSRNSAQNITVSITGKNVTNDSMHKKEMNTNDLQLPSTSCVQIETVRRLTGVKSHNDLKENSFSFTQICDSCHKLPNAIVESRFVSEVMGDNFQEDQNKDTLRLIENVQTLEPTNKRDLKELFSPELLRLLDMCLPDLAAKYPCISALNEARSFCMMSESSDNCQLLVRSLPSGLSTEEDVAITTQNDVELSETQKNRCLDDNRYLGKVLEFGLSNEENKNLDQQDRSDDLMLDLSELKNGSEESLGSGTELSETVKSCTSDKSREEMGFSSSSAEMMESVGASRSAPEGGNPSEEFASGILKKNTCQGSSELKKRLERQATFVIETAAQSKETIESKVETCKQPTQRERAKLNITSDEIDRIMRVFHMTQE